MYEVYQPILETWSVQSLTYDKIGTHLSNKLCIKWGCDQQKNARGQKKYLPEIGAITERVSGHKSGFDSIHISSHFR